MNIIIAGLTYFGTVFGAGFIFGVFREMVLTPVYGRTTAVLFEVPFMLVAIVAGAWIAVHRGSVRQSRIGLALVGIIGFVLVQIADFGVGLGLRGMSIYEQLNYLKSVPGQIYLGLLAAFVVMPLVLGLFVFRRHRRSEEMSAGLDGRVSKD